MMPAPDAVNYFVKTLGPTDFNSGDIFQNQADDPRRINASLSKPSIVTVRSPRPCKPDSVSKRRVQISQKRYRMAGEGHSHTLG